MTNTPKEHAAELFETHKFIIGTISQDPKDLIEAKAIDCSVLQIDRTINELTNITTSLDEGRDIDHVDSRIDHYKEVKKELYKL